MKLKNLFMPAALMIAMAAMPSCNHNDNDINNDDSKKLSKTLVCAKSMPEMPAKADAFRGKALDFCWRFADKAGVNLTENIAVSPISALLVMGMASEGASGNTQTEILEALGLSLQEVETMGQTLSNELNRSLRYYSDDYKGQKNLIRSINSIWGSKPIVFNEQGLAKISKDFYCDIFRSQDEFVDTDMMNKYIKENTNDLLDVKFSSPFRMALMNVLYVKEIWNETGDDLQESDSKHDFENTDKSITSKKFLNGYYQKGKAMKTEKYRKFFTETNSGFSITFIVPNDGYSVQDVYNYATLSDATEYEVVVDNKTYLTRCIFPEFNAELKKDIKDVIKDMGVNDLFDTSRFQFNNLISETVGIDQLSVSEIKQETKFEVLKSGIEGAAVTVMEFTDGAVGPGDIEYEPVYEDFVVDKAFAYTFQDQYGNVLFSGVVNKVK